MGQTLEQRMEIVEKKMAELIETIQPQKLAEIVAKQNFEDMKAFYSNEDLKAAYLKRTLGR